MATESCPDSGQIVTRPATIPARKRKISACLPTFDACTRLGRHTSPVALFALAIAVFGSGRDAAMDGASDSGTLARPVEYCLSAAVMITTYAI